MMLLLPQQQRFDALHVLLVDGVQQGILEAGHTNILFYLFNVTAMG